MLYGIYQLIKEKAISLNLNIKKFKSYDEYSIDEIKKIIQESKTIPLAARKLNTSPKKVRNFAKWYGIYISNQGKKGTVKSDYIDSSFEIQKEIFLKKFNTIGYQAQSYKLKNNLFKYGLLENKCDICGLTTWNNKPINLELHHKSGDKTDNRLENLQVLCPNCHSQTETFRAKNIKNKHGK